MTTIVWDVDDVLNDLMRRWFDEQWTAGTSSLRYEDLTSNPPHEVLGVPLASYLASLDAFRAERYAALPPQDDARDWFVAHGHRCRHVALSAVPAAFAHISAEWVLRHFGAWIQTFAFVPARGAGGGMPGLRTKQEYLSWWIAREGGIFIDDREDNVRDAAALGLRGVVMPRPWNSARGQSRRQAFDTLTALVENARDRARDPS